MQTITTIGLDIAKSVFQVHGADAEGKLIIRRQLKHRYVWHSSRSCRGAALVSRLHTKVTASAAAPAARCKNLRRKSFISFSQGEPGSA